MAKIDSKGTGSESRLGALGHGLAVFDMFAIDRPIVTPAEIARHLGLHKSTASRIASNLAAAGYLVPAATGGYRLGRKLIHLGAIASADTDLTSVSMRRMQTLVDEVGETCHVGVLEGHEAMTIALVDGSYSVRLHSWVGKRSAAHSTAMGKVLLAGLTQATVETMYPTKTLPKVTERTVDNVDDLLAQLEMVRKHGFALDDEEFEVGLRCVAAPIYDEDRQVVAALTIAGSASRLTMSKIDYYVDKVQSYSAAISADLGAPRDHEEATVRSA